MEAIIYLVVMVVSLAISALQLFMVVRAIMSWLPFDDSSPLERFVFLVTEPIILPVRNVLSKFDLFSNLPIDLSFFIAYLILILISSLLQPVIF